MTTRLENTPAPRIVLAYSSGLENSDAISWLVESYAAEIVAVTLDFGQGRELEALRDRALEAGAVRAHVLDVADAFANQFVLPALKAGALYADGRPMTTGLERALLAQKLVEIATIEQTGTGALVVAVLLTAQGHDPQPAMAQARAQMTAIQVKANRYRLDQLTQHAPPELRPAFAALRDTLATANADLSTETEPS